MLITFLVVKIHNPLLPKLEISAVKFYYPFLILNFVALFLPLNIYSSILSNMFDFAKKVATQIQLLVVVNRFRPGSLFDCFSKVNILYS